MKNANSISFCIATYNRNLQLQSTLESLTRLILSNNVISIIVIDNNPDGRARSVVEKFRSKSSFNVKYDVEPEQNISLVRNRALTHVDSDYIAFIDDDEIISENWLLNIMATLTEHNADVVFGPVIRLLPNNSPRWAKHCPFFNKKIILPTGKKVISGGSGNVLFKRSILREFTNLFDLEYGLTGGEDSEAFFRIYSAGYKLVWCAEAIVYEHIDINRVNPKWIRMRGFRSGQTFARIFLKEYFFSKKIKWFSKHFATILFGLIFLPFIRLLSYGKFIMLSMYVYKSLGNLSVIFNIRPYKEYSHGKYE